MKIKKILGSFKRALLGILENNIERSITINSQIKKTKIGQSVDGKDIFSFSVNNGTTKILFMAAIHGNEIGTAKLAGKLTNYLFEHQKKYLEFSFFIIPCLNPDGYQEAIKNPDYFGGGKIGRLNQNKVDLNRNFQTPSFQSHATWTHGKNYSDITNVSAGTKGNSEPETAALIGYINGIKPDLILSFHNSGSDVVGNDLPLAQKLSQLFAKISGYRFVSVEEWNTFHQTGSSFEWCALHEIPLLEIEASGRWGSDWTKQKTAIIKVVELTKNSAA